MAKRKFRDDLVAVTEELYWHTSDSRQGLFLSTALFRHFINTKNYMRKMNKQCMRTGEK